MGLRRREIINLFYKNFISTTLSVSVLNAPTAAAAPDAASAGAAGAKAA
jgi:hypothetical protein